MARPPRVACCACERPRTPRCARHRASADDLAQVADQQQVLEMGGDGGEVLERVDRLFAPLGVARAQGRREDLLQQVRLTVGRRAKNAQVAPAYAVARELCDGGDDLPLGLVEVAHAAAHLTLDDTELFELTHELGLRLGLLEHVVQRVQRTRGLAHAHARTPRARPVATDTTGDGRGLRRASRRELLADHTQRQELVTLHAQDRAQARDVPLRIEAVAAGCATRRQQLLVLEVADLGDRDVGELLCERLAHGADSQRLVALAELDALGVVLLSELQLDLLVVRGCCRYGHQRAWKVSLYLPICTSSPSSRRCESMRERFTYVPLSDPQSSRYHCSARRISSAWSRETVTSSRNTSHSGRRPMLIRSPSTAKLSPTRPPPARITSAGPRAVTCSSSTGTSSPLSSMRYVAVTASPPAPSSRASSDPQRWQ